MARYKAYNYDQIELIPVSFAHQILPGSFEHALVYLIDEELDLSLFDARYSNDHNGRRAYDPAILLKIILLAYSRGVTSSRKIEALCRENVLFMAISANATPHFTTIADFISRSAQDGVCQHSCRMNHATASFKTVGLTGFNATGPVFVNIVVA